MKYVVGFILACVICTSMCSCSGKSAEQPNQGSKAELKVGTVEESVNKELALTFLSAVQDGDKSKMYGIANLTDAIVNDCREKLINIKQNKMSDKQRLECEHILRISGNIDFFVLKLRKIFPKSAVIQIAKSIAKEATVDTKHFEHTVTITYNKSEAFSDKTGRQVKTLVVHLQQHDRYINGRLIHEFSFYTRDFERIADKDFELVVYF